MTRVWRVRERDNDRGPFQGWEFASRFTGPRYPTPFWENIPASGRWRFGCRSLTQLRHWFGRRWVVDALGDRFCIALIRVPAHAARHGRYQVAFDHTPSVLEGLWPLSNILLPRKAWGPSEVACPTL